MNSVAGNKERLAVSSRGKKYGVSCDRYNAEASYRAPPPPGRSPPFPAPGGPSGRPRALLPLQRRLRRAGWACVHAGGSAGEDVRTLAWPSQFSQSSRSWRSPHP